jgi:hypothetical protein
VRSVPRTVAGPLDNLSAGISRKTQDNVSTAEILRENIDPRDLEQPFTPHPVDP